MTYHTRCIGVSKTGLQALERLQIYTQYISVSETGVQALERLQIYTQYIGVSETGVLALERLQIYTQYISVSETGVQALERLQIYTQYIGVSETGVQALERLYIYIPGVQCLYVYTQCIGAPAPIHRSPKRLPAKPTPALFNVTIHNPPRHLTQNATPPKSTKSRNSEFSIQISNQTKSQFEFVARDTEESVFLDTEDFRVGDVAFLVETVICRIRESNLITTEDRHLLSLAYCPSRTCEYRCNVLFLSYRYLCVLTCGVPGNGTAPKPVSPLNRAKSGKIGHFKPLRFQLQFQPCFGFWLFAWSGCVRIVKKSTGKDSWQQDDSFLLMSPPPSFLQLPSPFVPETARNI